MENVPQPPNKQAHPARIGNPNKSYAAATKMQDDAAET